MRFTPMRSCSKVTGVSGLTVPHASTLLMLLPLTLQQARAAGFVQCHAKSSVQMRNVNSALHTHLQATHGQQIGQQQTAAIHVMSCEAAMMPSILIAKYANIPSSANQMQ